jgi:hypothetical protein
VGTGGIGLCNEFGIFKPIGYDDAQPGEQFPKLGVGLLTKVDNVPYDFGVTYEIEPFPVSVQPGADRVVYVVEPLPCRGYEARLRKTVQLRGAALDVVYELENTGKRAIRTSEYNHNFVAINRHAPGPGYRLRLPKNAVVADAPPVLAIEGNDVRWRETLPGQIHCSAPGPHKQTDAPFWELVHEPDGVGMSETVDFPVEKFSLWCPPHLIAPEVFVAIDLEPGARMTWTRRYAFFTTKD